MTDPDEQRNACGGACQAYFLRVPGDAHRIIGNFRIFIAEIPR